VHLKVHSEYSIVDSLLSIDALVQEAQRLNMSAIALTDETNLFALVKFYRKAISSGIKPIIGAEILCAQDDEIFRFTILCKNPQGYQHLIQLLSRAYLEGRRGDLALIQWDWLVNIKEGLIILSGGRDGDVGRALLQGRQALAEQRLKQWLIHFPDHFYLELQRTQRDMEEEYIADTVKLAAKYQVPVVATNDVRFLQQEDFEAHEARVCIHRGQTLDDPNRARDYSNQQYLKSAAQMEELFADIPEAINNTIEIAKRCNMPLQLGQVYLPNFPIPENTTLENYLAQQARDGLTNRLAHSAIKVSASREAYDTRLENELAVINKMGFAGYFLIVADFISWSKQQKIPVGPGRGSGAGSLVAYALGITELDPLHHELLFERFLNPERVSLPDFDIDFCMEGRDRVIEYVANRYGHESVAQIITYGTMAARAVVRDVGRALAMPYGFVDKIAKLIPFELGVTLEKALQQEELARRYAEEDEIRTLIDLAKKLEGLTRNAGKHAGGVVIAPTKLTDFVPLYCEAEGEHVVTQFDKDDIEAVGLVKFDFLGLRTLTIINWAMQTINKKREQQQLPPLDITQLPLDDQPTYALLKTCATTAIFQLESRGMKELIRRLQPDKFDDIMALVALFRPGPLQSGMVDAFVACKHGQAPVHYFHPDLKAILSSTYGVILYQDQVMQIAQVLAGYSLGSADILRNAMGKKKPQEMAKQRVIFIEGAKNRGIEARLAEHVFDLMEKFAGYGFNKSHSAAYAMITYQTAWLKAHYPAEFMAAVLSSDMDNTDKMVGFINECRDMKLTIMPPNINRGHYHFTVNDNGSIEYGLGAIKGVGQAAIENLIASREKDGDFSSLFDFCHRVDMRKVNRRGLEPLIRSGAMDCFTVSRASLMASLDKAMQAAEQQNRNSELGQSDLFGATTVTDKASLQTAYISSPPWSDAERLRGEKETLGLYLSGHPLQACEKELTTVVTAPISQLQVSGKSQVVIAGMITATRTITTRTGKRMAVLTIEDRSGRVDVTLFSELYQQVIGQLDDNTILIIRGTVSADEYTGGVRMLADTVLTLDAMRQQMAKRLRIVVESNQEVDRLLTELPDVIKPHSGGRCAITIAYQSSEAGAELILGEAWRVKPNTDLLNELNQLCGADKVMLEY
jgi:DNA polymerase-3 subunit alpha